MCPVYGLLQSSMIREQAGPIARKTQPVCHDTLDFIQVPGFPSAIRVFALTHSRRIVFNDAPWLISFSLGKKQ
jgi:hypothetical protein